MSTIIILDHYESSRSLSFDELGWDNKKQTYEDLIKYLLECGEMLQERDYIHRKDISDAINKVELDGKFYEGNLKNRIAFVNNQRDIDDILFYIRCAFAHGRFAILKKNNKKFFLLENLKRYKQKFYLKARMIICENTLLLWTKILKSGSKVMYKNIETIKNKYEKTIIDFIKSGKAKKENDIQDIVKQLHTGNYYKETINKLKKNNIKYDQSLSRWILKEK